MTEPKTPPPGKVWVTVEIDQDAFDSVRDADIWDLDHIGEVRGPDEEDPSDKCNRLLKAAEERFRNAALSFTSPVEPMHVAPNHLAAGAEFLADAVKVLREEL